MKPRIPITDKRFVYRDSAHTDIRARFEAEKAKLDEEKRKERTQQKIISMRSR